MLSVTVMKESGRFYRGDRVRWTSSSYGSTKTKTGTVVQCVPPNGYPDVKKFPVRTVIRHEPIPRPVRSYVIAVYRVNRKTEFYWPQESKLKRVTHGI